jgi:uncharacterized protein YjbJ (UPF0337 family)
MNRNIIEGNWKQFKGMIRGQFGRLTDDHVDEIAGKGEEVEGKIQETYGATQDAVQQQVKDLEGSSKQ